MSAYPTSASTGGTPVPPGQSAHMKRLRDMREHARNMDLLVEGQWAKALIEAQRTQHYYRKVLASRGAGGTDAAEPRQLLEKINLVRLAVQLHATILTADAPVTTPVAGFEPLAGVVGEIQDRSHWPVMCAQAAYECATRGACVLLAMNGPRGATIEIGNDEQWLPMGSIDARGQPEFWERRWIVKRMVGREERKYLRVERHTIQSHRSESGATKDTAARGHVIEQEAYATDSSETLCELDPAKRVTLAEALGAEVAARTPEVQATGLPVLPIVWMARGLRRNWPRPLLPDGEIDALDNLAATHTRLSRVHELHGSPKLRVSEGMRDPATGRVDATAEAVIDPEQIVGYIALQAELAEMLSYLDRITEAVLVILEVSPALLGIRLSGGATPDSYDKLRLESSHTLSAGRRAAPYMAEALARVMTAALWIESQRPLGGWTLPADGSAVVSARVEPRLPREAIDLAREQRELLEAGLTSKRRAVMALHGEDWEAVMDEIEEDDAARTALEKARSWSAVGNGPTRIDDNPDEPSPKGDPSPEPAMTGEAA